MKSRKFLSLVLIVTMLLSLCGCTDDDFFTKKQRISGEISVDGREWPTGIVTVICPWSSGGLTDQVNRAMTNFGEFHLGYSLKADNIVGEDGFVALTQYLDEPANSNNLILAGEGSFAVAPLAAKIDYKFEDFIPIINIFSSTFILIAHPSTKVKNFDDFKKYVRDKKIKAGTNGRFSSSALQCAALFNAVNSEAKIVPYNGGSEVLKAITLGEIPFAVIHSSLAKKAVMSKSVNPVIAFDNRKLIDEVYNLDCVEDYGLDTWMTNICAVFMRKNSDEKVIQKVYDKFKAILDDRKFLFKAEKLGVNIDVKTGAEVKEYIESCKVKAEKYANLIAE